MTFMCGGGPTAPTDDGRWPDTHLDEPCCVGSALDGPGACTCWRPVYNLEQQPIDEDVARLLAAGIRPVTRTQMCADCAYRPGSPEKSGDPTFVGDAQHLERIARDDEPFWCHQGMRIPIAWRHPSGMEIPAHPGSYRPAIRDDVAYKADGQPAELCAGWDARRRALGGEPR